MSITGAEQLEGLAAALEAAGSVLRREIQGALRASAPALIHKAQQSARANLPKAGGLNERVAADAFVVQDRSTTIQAGIRIGTASSDARGSNRGRIRHPVFGHRDRWVEQDYRPAAGWFDKAMESGQAEVAAAVAAAMAAVAGKVTHA